MYEITGIVPTPMSDPARPYFNHSDDTRPGAAHQIGEAGHKIRVTTTNKEVAKALLSVFRAVFDDAKGKRNA